MQIKKRNGIRKSFFHPFFANGSRQWAVNFPSAPITVSGLFSKILWQFFGTAVLRAAGGTMEIP